jgi:hypothetical protein
MFRSETLTSHFEFKVIRYKSGLLMQQIILNMFQIHALKEYIHLHSEPTNAHWQNTLEPFKHRIKSHLPFADIIRSSPYSPH